MYSGQYVYYGHKCILFPGESKESVKHSPASLSGGYPSSPRTPISPVPVGGMGRPQLRRESALNLEDDLNDEKTGAVGNNRGKLHISLSVQQQQAPDLKIDLLSESSSANSPYSPSSNVTSAASTGLATFKCYFYVDLKIYICYRSNDTIEQVAI